MRRRVVITGMGAITPLGHNVPDLFRSQLEGRSGVGPLRAFTRQGSPTRFGARVKASAGPRHVKGAQRWTHAGPNSQFAAAAAQQALADADLLEGKNVDRTRIGVYLGSGEGT